MRGKNEEGFPNLKEKKRRKLQKQELNFLEKDRN